MDSLARRDTGNLGYAALRKAGLDPQPMVDWLSPLELLRSGVRTVLAATFGNYADKREVQAALSPDLSPVTRDYSDQQELWFDFAADVGDGFNPTYALAWLLAQPSLTIRERPRPEGWVEYVTQGMRGKTREQAKKAYELPAGRFIVLGGDQVYPTAMRDEYRKRLVDPFSVAFHSVGTPDPARQLFALPGNHDWYDGLTSFIRLFCQQRQIGPLETCQERSYFALKLPHDWWLWGIDVQLEADLDEPQQDYFKAVLEHMVKVAGSRPQRLILCTGQPTWVHCGASLTKRHDTLPAKPRNHDTLAYFERLIRDKDIQLAATISGDHHHYAHYAPSTAGEPERITAGGGGAYLYPTHHLPERLEVPDNEPNLKSRETASTGAAYTLKTAYPDADASRGLRTGVWKLPWNNLRFAIFLGVLYLVFAWIVQSTSKTFNDPFVFLSLEQAIRLDELKGDTFPTLIDALAVIGLADWKHVGTAYWHLLRHSPSSMFFGLLVILALWKFRAVDRKTGQWVGMLHGVLHLILAMVVIWGIAHLNLNVLHLKVDTIAQVALFTVEMVLGGGLLGGLLFAAYLFLSSWWSGAHLNETYSSQAIEDFKNFLRIHIDRDGALTIFPIAIPVVPKDGEWTVRDRDKVAPAAGDINTELIGTDPIRIAPTTAAPAQARTQDDRPTVPIEARRASRGRL